MSNMAIDENQNQRFVTTHWSVVLAAGQVDTAKVRSALEELCRWPCPDLMDSGCVKV
jgi:transketolase